MCLQGILIINHYLLKMKSLIIASTLFLILICEVNAQYPLSNVHQNQNNRTSILVKTDSLIVSEKAIENVWDHLTIISDSRIDTLLQIHREESLRNNGLDGYRVQIFQGTKDQSYQMKSKFLSMYPDYKVYVLFQTPDFKVRVGDFRTRSEALKMRSLIKDNFTSSFIVDGEINFPDLIKE